MEQFTTPSGSDSLELSKLRDWLLPLMANKLNNASATKDAIKKPSLKSKLSRKIKRSNR